MIEGKIPLRAHNIMGYHPFMVRRSRRSGHAHGELGNLLCALGDPWRKFLHHSIARIGALCSRLCQNNVDDVKNEIKLADEMVNLSY